MLNVNNQQPNAFPDKTEGVTIKEEKVTPSIEAEKVESKVLKETDKAKINSQYKDSGHAVASISFANKDKDVEPVLTGKEDLNVDEIKILEFISKMNEQTFDVILKAFDQMIEHARKLMEENKKYMKEVVIPKEEIMKQEMMKSISIDGYVIQSKLTSDIKNKQALNTLDIYFIGAGIATDLVTPGLALKRTLDSRQVKDRVQEKYRRA